MSSKLIIDLTKLHEDETTEINSELDPKKIEVEFDDLHYKSPLRVHGYLEKMPEVLIFKGELSGVADKICGRCLEELPYDIKERFDFAFEIKGKTEIDVTDDLREMMILAHPFTFLCREDCKGLCAGCGVNLNLEACKCNK
ncbi:MAG: DUF177 domain-containing protein [Candidatus Omnitrophica bacterium]|nr:DUF177 domain-containing protein [Candidatus Omnitrophota bacterium]